MKHLLYALPLILFVHACTETISDDRSIVSLRVTLQKNTLPCGSNEATICPFSMEDNSFTATVTVEALTEDFSTQNFNGGVLLTTVPSGILSSSDPDVKYIDELDQYVKVITLEGGRWTGTVNIRGAFGEIAILAEEIGYTPVVPVNEAACFETYPEAGCFRQDDNDPTTGTGAAGVSSFLYFDNPRIYDIQKPLDESLVGQREGDMTPLDGFRVQVDGSPYLGSDTCAAGESRLVVTHVGVAGFYVTDMCNRHDPMDPTEPFTTDYASLYVYTYNTPEELSRGDCLLHFQGAVDEFNGFTEMKNPFWTVDYCEEDTSYCTAHEPKCTHLLDLYPPTLLDANMLRDDLAMERLESSIVTVRGGLSPARFKRCDLNDDGVVDWNDPEEDVCYDECTDDPSGCIVKENYDRYFTWFVRIGGQKVGVVTRGIIDEGTFDPEVRLDETIYSITGTLKHLSFGRPAWIITPRDAHDFCVTEADCQ